MPGRTDVRCVRYRGVAARTDVLRAEALVTFRERGARDDAVVHNGGGRGPGPVRAVRSRRGW
ncbi:hypothetical protein [Dactylosporangium sp. NPDC048998]|uniref:hypothetical protein n=1 Tax=Dactylosporangium sp. NPDC048998 TaxID=3363976 RepID=UPI00371C37D4